MVMIIHQRLGVMGMVVPTTYDQEGVASKRDGNNRLQGLLEGSIIILYY